MERTEQVKELEEKKTSLFIVTASCEVSERQKIRKKRKRERQVTPFNNSHRQKAEFRPPQTRGYRWRTTGRREKEET